jgi:internalin A
MTREGAVQRIEWVAEKNLIDLDLSWLNLEELPLEIVNCTHLTRLNLSHNKITSIPEVLGQLFDLTWLDLGNNYITCIPEAPRANASKLYVNIIWYIGEELLSTYKTFN